MRYLMIVMMLAGLARADADAKRKNIALNATLCAAQDRAAGLMKTLRFLVGKLVKNPADTGITDTLKGIQEQYAAADGNATEIKEAMIAARAGTMSCSDGKLKKVRHCIQQCSGPGDCNDGACDEPDMALYLGIDGVPKLVKE